MSGENADSGLSSPWDVAPPSHTDGSLGSPDYENVKARAGGGIKKDGVPRPGGAVYAPQSHEASKKDRHPTGHGAHRPPPSRTRLTFQQPLDDAVDVEFIDIRHRRPAADPPAAAPPPARARVSHVLLPHATNPTSGGGGGGGSSSSGGSPPPAAPLPASSSSRHWNHEKNKMAANSSGQPRAAHGCARGSAAVGPGLLYRPIGRAGGGGAGCWRGRGLRAQGAGPWQRQLSDTTSARGILPPNGRGGVIEHPPWLESEVAKLARASWWWLLSGGCVLRG